MIKLINIINKLIMTLLLKRVKSLIYKEMIKSNLIKHVD